MVFPHLLMHITMVLIILPINTGSQLRNLNWMAIGMLCGITILGESHIAAYDYVTNKTPWFGCITDIWVK